MLRSNLLAVSSVAILSSTLCASPAPATSSRIDDTKLTIGRVNERVQIYMIKHEEPPAHLAVLYPGETPPTDSWGRPLSYEVPGPDGLPYDLVAYRAQPGGRTCGCGPGGPTEDIRLSDLH